MADEDPAAGTTDGAEEPPEESNVIRREAVLERNPECPLCGRQLALTPDHLVAFGPDDDPMPETADAIACPVCDGVSFIVE